MVAGGVLSVVVLYSLGFRESTQSTEDVASAAYADEVFARIHMALSDTNVTWQSFNSIRNYPSDRGWGDYLDKDKPGVVASGAEGKAVAAFGNLMSAASASRVSSDWPTLPPCLGTAGLVVRHDQGSPVVHVCFRAAKHERSLMSSPIFYTAVLFQGAIPERDIVQ